MNGKYLKNPNDIGNNIVTQEKGGSDLSLSWLGADDLSLSLHNLSVSLRQLCHQPWAE